MKALLDCLQRVEEEPAIPLSSKAQSPNFALHNWWQNLKILSSRELGCL